MKLNESVRRAHLTQLKAERDKQSSLIERLEAELANLDVAIAAIKFDLGPEPTPTPPTSKE